MSIKITEEGKTLLEDAILQDKKVVFSQIELIADVEKSPTEMVKRVDVSKVSASDYNTITVQAQIDNDGFLDTYYFNRANVYADEVLFAYDDGINICIPAETTKVINDLEMMMKIDSAVADLKIIYEGYVLRKDFDDMESKIQKINTTIKDMEANAVTQNDCTDQVSWNSQIVKKEFLTIGNMAFFRATGGFSTSRGSIVLATIPQGYFPETTRNQSSYELMGVFTSAYDKERRNCYVTLNCLSGNVDLQISNNEAYSDTRSDDNVQMIFYAFWNMNAESQGGTGCSRMYGEDIEKLRQSIQDSKKEIVRSSREIDSLKEELVNNNMLLLGNIINNSYVNNGVITSYSGWSRTEYIDVSRFNKICVFAIGRESIYNYKYNNRKNVIGNIKTQIGENVVDVSNCNYIILSTETSYLKNYELSVIETNVEYRSLKNEANIAKLNNEIYQLSDFLSVKNKYLMNGNGNIYDTQTYDCSDLIKVSENDILYYSLDYDSGYPCIALYNDNKKYVEDLVTGKAEGTLTIESNGYVRLCCRKTFEDKGYFMINKHSTIKTMLNNHEERIAILENDSDELPSYYDSELENIKNNVIEHQGTNSISFAFLTDLHNGESSSIRTSNMNAIKSVSFLENKIPLDCIVFGGDYISNNADTTVSTCYSQIEHLMKYVNKIKTQKFMLRGNHDSNFLNSSEPFTDEMFYKSTNKFFESNNNLSMNTGDLGMNVGFIDIDNIKVRLIFTNMTDSKDTNAGFAVTNEQVAWFGNTALNFSNKADKSEWAVVVFAHSYFVPTTITEGTCNISPDMHNILKAFKNGTSYNSYDFTEQGAMEVICAVVGHWHSDRSDTVDDIKIIASMQTANNGDEPADDGVTYSKEYGTENETAYDIITINRTERKIYCTRFGVGLDRKFTY